MTQFPVKISFKILALAPQMFVHDAHGNPLGFVRQKLLRFVEEVTVYADDSMSRPIYLMNADRVIDFSAKYYLADADGHVLGRVERHGFRSLWRASYDVFIGDRLLFNVAEQSVLVRLLDNVLDNIPFVGLLTGYLFNPTYLLTRPQQTAPTMQMVKRRSLLETEFAIDLLGDVDGSEQEVALLGLMMIILLERQRG